MEKKSEDKYNSNTGTTGAHVGETTTLQDSSTPSSGLSIGAHVCDVTKPDVWPVQYVQDILAAHPIGDPIWSHTNACDISIDTVNSAEALAGNHIIQHNITQGSTYTLRRPNPRFEDIELFVDAYVPPDSIEDDGRYQSMDNYNEWDKLLDTADVNDMGSFRTFTADNPRDYTNESTKSDIWIGECQS